MVIHLIGEQGHEEREAADVSRAGLSTVERLGGDTSTGFPLPINHTLSSFIVLLRTFDFSRKEGEINRNKRYCYIDLRPMWTVTSQLQTPFDTYTQEALHQVFLFLFTLCTAFCQLDNHTHVTCGQDGLHALDQLIKQPQELQRKRKGESSLQL